METKVLLFNLNFSSEEKINDRIKESETEGFKVTNSQLVSGNSFSKYTSNCTLIITLQK